MRKICTYIYELFDSKAVSVWSVIYPALLGIASIILFAGSKETGEAIIELTWAEAITISNTLYITGLITSLFIFIMVHWFAKKRSLGPNDEFKRRQKYVLGLILFGFFGVNWFYPLYILGVSLRDGGVWLFENAADKSDEFVEFLNKDFHRG